jgi:hypothetical protein
VDKNKLERHIYYLQAYHDDLDRQIKEDIRNYKDDALVATLKKKKLNLKDEIEQFKKQLEVVG